MSREDDDTDALLAKIAGGTRRHAPLPLLGTRRFELRRKLGAGAFGDVYEARDREHGTVVALKTLKSSHPDWIYRFKREFRIMGDLAHPNLVRMFELFREEERWYLTMELIDGARFDEHVRRAPAQLRSAFGQLALGLSELHRAGCLHRDVKPSNALVEATGKVVLLDFGLAVHQHAAVASAIAGTAPYMAPELGLHQAATEASDWYALGVMLYEALTGERPFTGDEAEMLRAKLRDPPPAPGDLRTGADPVLAMLALRLLAAEPAARPSAAEVLRELVGRAPAEHVLRRGQPGSISGRVEELALLEAAFEASRYRPSVVTVSGAAGIGKTALITAFVEQLRARQVPVYQGRCLERDAVPFKGLDAVIDELCHDLRRRPPADIPRLDEAEVAALAHVFPMVQRVDALARVPSRVPDPRSPGELHRCATGAVGQLFNAVGPVVLVIDDLQWTGDDSIGLLLELLAASAAPMLLIVAHRGVGVDRAPIVERYLSDLTARGTALTELELGPLLPADVADWIAARAVAPMSTDHAVRETNGHPELLARLFVHARASTDEPIGLARIVEHALAALAANERQLLEVVASAAGPTRPDVLFAAAGIAYDPLAIDQLVRHKLILRSGAADRPMLDAYHARIRETVRAAIPTLRHGELARLLAGVWAGESDPS